jgi:hypothetical protein
MLTDERGPTDIRPVLEEATCASKFHDPKDRAVYSWAVHDFNSEVTPTSTLPGIVAADY